MNLYIIVLVVIVLVLLTVSLSRIRAVKTKADFLVAGRSLPAYVLVATLLSSWIGAGSLFAGAENAFKNGFAALWQPAGGWAGLMIIYFVAPRARKFAQYTVPDLLEARYNTTARVLGTVAILFAYTGITSYQMKGGGDILHLATGVDNTLGMYIVAAFVITFTALAGMSSVAYLDVVIGLLITLTSFLAVPMLLGKVGGWSGLHTVLAPDRFQVLGHLTLARALEFFMPTFLLMLGNQSMYQKFFSAKTEKDARKAVVGWIIGTVVLETLIVGIAVLGSGLFGANPELMDRPRETIPFTARHGLPPLVGALLMGAVFAKVISTANNYLFSPATNLVNDVYTRFINKEATHKNVLVVSRVLVVLLGLFALLQGAYWESILTMMLYAYTIYSAAITPVVMGAFFSRRVTARAAVSSILLGTAVTAFWNLCQLVETGIQSGQMEHGLVKDLILSLWLKIPDVWRQRDAIFPALIISVVALVMVSLATAAPRREQWEPFFAEEAE